MEPPLRLGSLLFSTKFLQTSVIILSTSEGLKDESTLQSPSGFEQGTFGLRIQCLIH